VRKGRFFVKLWASRDAPVGEYPDAASAQFSTKPQVRPARLLHGC
jgi:hypothetical protein